jgi:Plavaka transposase
VFTEEFPRADIHELITPDILHQLIKGAFKDHLITWIEEYLKNNYREKQLKVILDKIDRR